MVKGFHKLNLNLQPHLESLNNFKMIRKHNEMKKKRNLSLREEIKTETHEKSIKTKQTKRPSSR